MERIFQKTLNEYCNRDYYPWHMPGHKRQENLNSHRFGVKQDVTELPGLDNLLAPEGAIAESMKQLTQIYGTWKSYYLVNGSTSGILTAISAVCKRGDTIILGRHCHKSVYHAVMLLELKPVYLYPAMIQPYEICSSVTGEQIEQALREHPEARAVIFPSPTYEGVLSDISSISKIVHKYGAKLIVDEAHGAHLEFGVNAPVSAVRCGADLVIQSLHKTLPCYTQCAILHICKPEAKNPSPDNRFLTIEELQKQVERYLNVYQTSSPSYLLVANMEEGIASMEEWRNTRTVSYYDCLRRYREKWSTLQVLHLLTPEEVKQAGGFAYDESKLVIGITKDGLNGAALLQELEEKYGMVLEMASLHYVLAMTSVADSEEAFSRLDDALQKIDKTLVKENTSEIQLRIKCHMEREELLSAEEKNRTNRKRWMWEAEGLPAGDFVTVYPPGVPVLVPGEVITKEKIEYLQSCMENGLTVHGVEALWEEK